jgi:hypothetical protein
MSDEMAQVAEQGQMDIQAAVETIAAAFGVDPGQVMSVLEAEFQPQRQPESAEQGGAGPLIGG